MTSEFVPAAMADARRGGSVLSLPGTPRTRRTYERLIDAALQEVRESGSLSPERVADRAEVATATFYVYFGSKDEALAAVFDRVLEELNSQMRRVLAIEPLVDLGPRAVLTAAVEAVVAGFRRDALVFRLALARLPEEKLLRDVYRSREEEGLAVVRRFVELGAKAGILASEDPELAAEALLIVLQGCNNHLVAREDAPGRLVQLIVAAAERVVGAQDG